MLDIGRGELNHCRDKCTSPRCLLQTPLPAACQLSELGTRREKNKIMTFGADSTAAEQQPRLMFLEGIRRQNIMAKTKKNLAFPALLAFSIFSSLSLSFLFSRSISAWSVFCDRPHSILFCRLFLLIYYLPFIFYISHAIWYRGVDFPS